MLRPLLLDYLPWLETTIPYLVLPLIITNDLHLIYWTKSIMSETNKIWSKIIIILPISSLVNFNFYNNYRKKFTLINIEWSFVVLRIWTLMFLNNSPHLDNGRSLHSIEPIPIHWITTLDTVTHLHTIRPQGILRPDWICNKRKARTRNYTVLRWQW